MPESIFDAPGVLKKTVQTRPNRHDRRASEKELQTAMLRATIPTVKNPHTREEILALQMKQAAMRMNARVIALREKYPAETNKYTDKEILETWMTFKQATEGEVFLAWLVFNTPK